MNRSPRVVFDTNILFSAVGWLGNPHRCVQAARRGECVSVICEAILAELAEKLQSKRGLNGTQTAAIADELRAFSGVVAIPGQLKIIAADSDDDAIVECAVVGGAEFIVSGDHHLLELKSHAGIQIVTAADFLNLVQRG